MLNSEQFLLGATVAGFLDFLRDHASGIFVFLAALVVFVVLLLWALQKFSWIFRLGRYSDSTDTVGAQSGSLVSVLVRFLVEIIREFRNLLALLIFLLFAGVLIYGVAMAMGGLDPAKLDSINKFIQVIVASLGGLVGSIIGYYFGEAGRKADGTAPPPPPPGTQSGSGAGQPVPAQKPPGT